MKRFIVMGPSALVAVAGRADYRVSERSSVAPLDP